MKKLLLACIAILTVGAFAPAAHANDVGDEFKAECHSAGAKIAHIERNDATSTYAISGPGVSRVAAWSVSSNAIDNSTWFQVLTLDTTSGYTVTILRQKIKYAGHLEDTIENGDTQNLWLGFVGPVAQQVKLVSVCIDTL